MVGEAGERSGCEWELWGWPGLGPISASATWWLCAWEMASPLRSCAVGGIINIIYLFNINNIIYYYHLIDILIYYQLLIFL